MFLQVFCRFSAGFLLVFCWFLQVSCRFLQALGRFSAGFLQVFSRFCRFSTGFLQVLLCSRFAPSLFPCVTFLFPLSFSSFVPSLLPAHHLPSQPTPSPPQATTHQPRKLLGWVLKYPTAFPPEFCDCLKTCSVTTLVSKYPA